VCLVRLYMRAEWTSAGCWPQTGLWGSGHGSLILTAPNGDTWNGVEDGSQGTAQDADNFAAGAGTFT
jgi:hypothetical protein